MAWYFIVLKKHLITIKNKFLERVYQIDSKIGYSLPSDVTWTIPGKGAPIYEKFKNELFTIKKKS